jgi:hypothetical protein
MAAQPPATGAQPAMAAQPPATRGAAGYGSAAARDKGRSRPRQTPGGAAFVPRRSAGRLGTWILLQQLPDT